MKTLRETHPKQSIARVALAKLTAGNFIGKQQSNVLARLLLTSEERLYFCDLLTDWAQKIDAMPATYGQDGKGDQAIAHLHYFTAGYDAWITEKDQGSPGDDPSEAQWQAFGLARFYGGEAETGYICLPEILNAGAEIDLYWQPKTLAEIKAGLTR